MKDLAFYAQYSSAVDPVSNSITLSLPNKDFQLATGKQVEIGVKQSFCGGRGEWTLAGCQIVKNNLLTPDPNDPTKVQQVGQQSSRGIEATAGLAPDGGWRIDASGCGRSTTILSSPRPSTSPATFPSMSPRMSPASG